MAKRVKLKEAFDVQSKYGAFYTGGNIEWHGDMFYCQTAASVSLLNIDNGAVSKTVGKEDANEDASVETFTSDGERIVSSHTNGLLKLWDSDGKLVKKWKHVHKGPVARLVLNGNRLASGGADGVVLVWDLDRHTCLSRLKGCQGCVDVVEYDREGSFLFASGDDGKIHSWKVAGGDHLFYHAHFSKVTSLVFSHDNKHLVSSGRDKVLVLWQVGTTKSLKTIPMYELVESVVALPPKFKLPNFKSEPDRFYVAAAGESGLVRVWDVAGSSLIYEQTDSLVSRAEEGGRAVTRLLCDPKAKGLAVVSADHNIIVHHLKSFACLKQFVGFSDEILVATFVGKDDAYLAVATNSPDIKLYDDATMSCRLLKGHSDIVTALSTSPANPDLMVSSGKDKSVRLWLLEGGSMSCVGEGRGHASSVNSVCFFNTSPDYFVSASQDTCLKLWQIPAKLKGGAIANAVKTVMAHPKDVNFVAVSPNDRVIATASQDKTVKLWDESLALIGTLAGHKRGVWCVRFSPVDQVVVTSSTDCTIKLWSVADLFCLKTFEGHEASVLNVEFISGGMQVLSAGSDGAVGLFDVKTGACAAMYRHHEGRVWALAVRRDQSGMVTGGSDSVLIKWRDITDELKQQQRDAADEKTGLEQKLANYVHDGKLLKALKLALRLDRPLQVIKIVRNVVDKGEEEDLAAAIRELRNEQKQLLLKYVAEWNTDDKKMEYVHTVLNVLIDELPRGFDAEGLPAIIDQVLPYTEKHSKNCLQYFTKSHYLIYLNQQIDQL